MEELITGNKNRKMGGGGGIRGCLRYLFICQVALRGNCFKSWLDCVLFSHDPMINTYH